jgi:hypothetical protein
LVLKSKTWADYRKHVILKVGKDVVGKHVSFPKKTKFVSGRAYTKTFEKHEGYQTFLQKNVLRRRPLDSRRFSEIGRSLGLQFMEFIRQHWVCFVVRFRSTLRQLK